MAKRDLKKCKAVARDVLLQLRMKRYAATPGQYIYVFDESQKMYDMSQAKRDATSFKTFFKKNKKVKCDVCALGSAFVSLVNVENKCSIEEMESDRKMFPRLEKLFGPVNLNLMESAFECSAIYNCSMPDKDHALNVELMNQATVWGGQFLDDNKRLRAIMQNVIRNGGDFKLPQKYIAKAKQILNHR